MRRMPIGWLLVVVVMLCGVGSSEGWADVLISSTTLTGSYGDQIEVRVYCTGAVQSLSGLLGTCRVDVVTLNPTSDFDLVNAFDLQLDAASGSSLHQAKPYHGMQYRDTPDLGDHSTGGSTWGAADLVDPRIDTHFLLEDWDGAVELPNEDSFSLVGTNANGEQEHLGSYLRVIAAINCEDRAETLPLLHVAVPFGSTAVLKKGVAGEFGAGDGEYWVLPQGGLVVGPCVPEPATLALFIASGAWVLRRRRRT